MLDVKDVKDNAFLIGRGYSLCTQGFSVVLLKIAYIDVNE